MERRPSAPDARQTKARPRDRGLWEVTEEQAHPHPPRGRRRRTHSVSDTRQHPEGPALSFTSPGSVKEKHSFRDCTLPDHLTLQVRSK